MRPVQLLQLTDTHLFGDAAAELYDVNTSASLTSVLADALGGSRLRPDAIVVTGDIAEDESRAAYARFRTALAGVGVPVLCLPGNHDDPKLMAEGLDSDGFQFCGSKRLGGWHVVLLSSHQPRDPSGWLAASELDRLDVALRDLPGCPALVAVHHPPAQVGSRWLDGVGLLNPSDLLEVIDRHPEVCGVIAGHVHQESEHRHHDVRILTTPSTCAQFLPHTEQCVMDQRPPGYRWLELQRDGTIDTEVVWLRDWRPAKRVRDTRVVDT